MLSYLHLHSELNFRQKTPSSMQKMQFTNKTAIAVACNSACKFIDSLIMEAV